MPRPWPLVLAALLTTAARSDLADLSKDPKQWPMAAHDYANTRFGPLDQINAGNVGGLKDAWMFSVGENRGQEAAPLVIDGVMYLISSYPNKAFALDAATGALKWTYIPNTDPASQGEACCDVVTRGIAYDAGKIFLVTLDNHVIALDARTGREQWATQAGAINLGETTTNAPFVAKGHVFVGIGGGEMGVRGRITALDESTGKIAYVAYSAGPDKDVKIGPGFKPFYDFMKGTDLGVHKWQKTTEKPQSGASSRRRIGVQLIGDDSINSPPAHLMSWRGHVDNVRGYSVWATKAIPPPRAASSTPSLRARWMSRRSGGRSPAISRRARHPHW